jgi:hypothetical protein
LKTLLFPMTTYYLMRVKGKAKIPDYIQLRDENLTLIGYFRPGRKERLDKVIKDPEQAQQVQAAIDQLTDYGKMTKVEVS